MNIRNVVKNLATTKSRRYVFLSLASLLGFALTLTGAHAELLVYEPFDYAPGDLNGQDGALGTTGTWNSWDSSLNKSWTVYPEGTLSGVVLSDGVTPTLFDGTVANLPTTGGYAGHAQGGNNLSADIALDPSVTATFQTGTTTWISYVSVVAWNRNPEHPNLILGTAAAPNGSRGDNYGGIGTGGTGFGTGGGPTRNNRFAIYPMFYSDGQYNNVMGAIPGNAYNQGGFEVPAADRLAWGALDGDGNFGAPNIVVMKLEWNADSNGEDIISVARFHGTDVISETNFDAMIAAQPNLSSANWAPANKPDIDETQLDTITLMGVKYFVDEIRIGTTFDSAFSEQAAQGALTCQLGILDLEANGGINPATGAAWQAGDQYRLVFHTNTDTGRVTGNESTDIGFYNDFVQALADASTAYPIGAAFGATWKVIGSTSTVDARDNTATNPSLHGTGHAIFLLDGSTIVANDYADLWDGSVQHIINITERGETWNSWPYTGTKNDGSKRTGGSDNGPLGPGTTGQGNGGSTSEWVWRVWTGRNGNLLPLYAMSDPLTVISATDEQLINVNFNSWVPAHNPGPTEQEESTLEGPAGGLGTSWNQYTANSSSGTMVDSTGAATTVTVATNFSEGRYDGTQAALTMLRATLTDFSKGVTSRTVTISGLEAGGMYDIWLVSHRHQGSVAERQKGTWTAVNATPSPTTQLVDGTTEALNGATFVAGVNYALFERVVADGSGQIVFNGKAATIADGYDNNYRLHLNGVQIATVIPPDEPSADDSTVEASPTSVPADGVSTSTITVTLMTADETPVAGRQVELEITAGPGMADISPAGPVTTDADGVATFTVSSSTIGTEVFTATDITDGEPGIVITQTASVAFSIVSQTSLIPGYTPPAPPPPDAPQTFLAPTTAPPPEPNAQAVPETSETAEPLATVTGPIRVTEYYLTEGDFGGTTATVALDQDLAADYFILVRGSRAGNGLSMPDNDYARVAAVPGGRGGLAASGAADAIGLQRAAAAFDWEGVVTVVESTVPGSPAGFRLVDAVVTTLSGTSGSQVCAPWGDASRVVPFGGYRGGGAELTGGAANRYQGTSVYVRLTTSGNDTLDWQRDPGGETLADATMTTFVVEWGADWTVQHAAVAGSAGGDGVDGTGDYTTAAIDPVARANTWVWGTGIRANSAIGTCAESCVVTLGDGVNLNATESTVAVGSEYTDAYSFDVYALTHPELAVDHRFKPDGDLKGLDIPVAVDPAPAGARFAWLYNACNGTSSRFPRPRMWSRYTADETVTVSRGYDGAQFPAWIQGIDFSALSE